MSLRKIFTIIVLTLIITAVVLAQSNTTDPYEILNKYFAAMGGLDRLKAEKSQYVEAQLKTGGLTGTLKAWSQAPDLSRNEVDFGILKITQGSHGDYEWALDTNGKLQKTTTFDEATLKRKELKIKLNELEFADPKSQVFTVTYQGIEKVNDKECYILKLANNINSDSFTYYINSQNYLLEKTVSSEGESSHDIFYGDYRKISDLMVAFYNKDIDHQSGQEQEITYTQYISNPQINPALFEAPGESAKDYHFTNGNSAENIPMEFIENHIYVPVIIDCQQSYWVLDTGAGMSVIGEKLAKELGLEAGGDIKGLGVGGAVDIRFATIPSLSVPGIEFDPQTVAVINLDEINRLSGTEMAGILGFDFLSRFVTKIDYANEYISCYDPETFVYSGNGQQLNLHLKNNLFSVTAAIDNNPPDAWIVDIGASYTSLQGDYAYRANYTKQKYFERVGRGAGSYFDTRWIKCQSLDLAGFKVTDQFLTYEFEPADTALTTDNIGTLGNSLFRNFVIYCDYTHEKFYVEKGDNFNKEFPIDKSGLQLARTPNDDIEVLFISPGSPAAKAGFTQADIIRSINGIETKYFKDIVAIRELLCGQPETELAFNIERGGKITNIKLKLKDLL